MNPNPPSYACPATTPTPICAYKSSKFYDKPDTAKDGWGENRGATIRGVWYAINGRHHAGNTLALQLNRANNDDSLDCRDANRSRNADTFYYGRYPHNTANDDQCTSDSRSRSLTGAQPFRRTSLPSPYLSRRHFTSRFKAAVPVPSQRQN